MVYNTGCSWYVRAVQRRHPLRSIDVNEFGRDKREALTSWRPQLEAPFALDEYAERTARLRSAMDTNGVGCLFLTAPESIHYLTGYAAEWYQANGPEAWFPASGVAVHVDHEEPIVFETCEEATLVAFTVAARDIRIFDLDGIALQERIAEELRQEGWLSSTVGLELRSYRPHRAASETFQAFLEQRGASIVDGTSLLRRLRRYKSPQELAYVRTAQRIADIGMAAAHSALGPGVTELEVYAAMVQAMACAGGEVAAIPLPVVSGPRAATVHGLAGRRVIMPGDIVNVDVSGVYNRYHANMARCFSIGEPTEPVRERIAAANGVVDALAEVLTPNLPVQKLLVTAESYFAEHQLLGDEWWIGGYELGVAFAPDWVGDFAYSLGDDDMGEVFAPGEVCNFEANFYLPQAAGLVLSINTFVVTETEATFINATPSALSVIE
jgi:Xaa-Pro aminopeptidase